MLDDNLIIQCQNFTNDIKMTNKNVKNFEKQFINILSNIKNQLETTLPFNQRQTTCKYTNDNTPPCLVTADMQNQ